MNAGDCATFKAGDNNGHAIVNKSNEDVVLLEVGTRSQKEIVHYTDKDLINDVDRTQTKKYTKLANIAPKPKYILLSKFIEIDPSSITVSKYT